MSRENLPSSVSTRVSHILKRSLFAAALLSLIAEGLVHRHSYFSLESSFGFYPLFGFIAYIVIVRGAVWLRRYLQREEDYYD